MQTSQNNNMQRRKPPLKGAVFVRYMQEKLAITVIMIALALLALIYVLYDIISTRQDQYNQIVLNQQGYDSRTIPYRRGSIIDRNGNILATSERVYNLIIDPSQIMPDTNGHLEVTIRALNSMFGYDMEELRKLITENEKKAYIRYARQLSKEEKDAFEQLSNEINEANKAEDGNKARVRGVWFEDEYKRIYPHKSLACNVIGFATSDGASGNGGIEQYYNSVLNGSNGREYGYLNDDSNLERVIKPAVNGNIIVSTIDLNIQNIVEKYIKIWNDNTGSDRIGVIVMNPNNGEILAMASDSIFDLNNPREVSEHYTTEELMSLGEKEAMETYNRKNSDSRITSGQVREYFTDAEILSYGQQVVWNQNWRNFTISDAFEPGSTAKIVTVAAGLEEGLIHEEDNFFCEGRQVIDGWLIQCVNRSGHGWLTLQETLMQSCNDAMMQIAAKEGKERFSKYLKAFGFGQKTGIDLPGEADTSGLVYSADNMGPSDLATNSFGQNYNCTMVQMAAAYASVINGGSYYEPHVVKQIQNEQGSVVQKKEPVLVREVVSEGTSNFIKQSLFRTVSEGTGKAAVIEGYEIAGKTGTAEKHPRGTDDYVVSFCGFAPVMNPEVLIYVVIDTPHVEDQPHSTFASGIFRQIMTDILPYLSVFPSTEAEYLPEDAQALLPDAEGINGTEDVTETEAEEETLPAKVYATEEYVESGMIQSIGSSETAGESEP